MSPKVLVARYQTGETQAALAEAFLVHRSTVTSLLIRAGVQIRRPGIPLDQLPIAAKLYQSGWSLLRVGERFEVDANTVAGDISKARFTGASTEGVALSPLSWRLSGLSSNYEVLLALAATV